MNDKKRVMRKILPAILILLLTVSVSGVEFNIRDRCQDEEEVLFSISNITNAHAAGPDYYQGFSGDYGREGKQVCASGISNARITRSCDKLENPVLSFYDTDSGRTHLSPVDERNDYVLCSRDLATSVWKSCPGDSEPIVSIYDPVENHVAEPGHYKWQVCGALFENASLAYNFTMSGNKTFVMNGNHGARDNESVNEDFPGYVTVENDSIISGIVSTSSYPQRLLLDEQGNASFSKIIYSSATNLMWFIPFTTGDMYDIENRLSRIDTNDFLNQFNPNFAFNIAEKILVKVTLELTDIDLVTDMTLGTGFHNLVIEKEGVNNKGKPEVSINETQE